MKKLMIFFGLIVGFISNNMFSMVDNQSKKQNQLKAAIEVNNADFVRYAIRGGASQKIAIATKVGTVSPLYALPYAISIDSFDALRKLLELDGDPNFEDVSTETSVLNQAIKKGSFKAVKLLLVHKANPQFADTKKQLPFLLAAVLWTDEKDSKKRVVRKKISDLIYSYLK